MKYIFFCFLMIIFFKGFSQSDEKLFNLFDGTAYSELAQMVQTENTSKFEELIHVQHLNVNFQEKKWGITLLNLAVKYNKLKSVERLLKNKANVAIRDSFHFAPIHICIQSIGDDSNGLKILELLLKNKADPNDMVFRGSGADYGLVYYPLMGSVKNLEAFMLLRKYGANSNVKYRQNYVF